MDKGHNRQFIDCTPGYVQGVGQYPSLTAGSPFKWTQDKTDSPYTAHMDICRVWGKKTRPDCGLILHMDTGHNRQSIHCTPGYVQNVRKYIGLTSGWHFTKDSLYTLHPDMCRACDNILA